MTEILTAAGAFIGAASASFVLIWRIIPKTMNNDLAHIREEIKDIRIGQARLDERMKNAEDDIKALFTRLNTHINGETKK